MIAGVVGVPLGSILAQKLRVLYPNADPLICAGGLLISAPLIFFGTIFAGFNAAGCYALIFFGQIAININWSIVADMLLVRQIFSLAKQYIFLRKIIAKNFYVRIQKLNIFKISLFENIANINSIANKLKQMEVKF